MDTMLRKALWGFLRPLVQLITNLLSPEVGEEWGKEFKRFLRKESCWALQPKKIEVDRFGLDGDSKALLQQNLKSPIAHTLTPARHRRTIERRGVPEVLLTAEVLIIPAPVSFDSVLFRIRADRDSVG